MTYTPTPEDFDALVSLSQAAGIDPGDVALVLFHESGFNPANPGPPGASPNEAVGGLNQMNVPNLQSLGINRAAWLAMSAAEQLPHVFDFWGKLAKSFHGGTFPTDAGDLIALNFLPGAYAQAGAATNRDGVIAGKAGPYAWAYNDNPPFQNAAGAITVNSLASYLAGFASRGGARWAQLTNGIAAAVARAGAGGTDSGSNGSGSTDPGVVTLDPITIVGSKGSGVATALLLIGAGAIALHMMAKG